MIRKSYKTIKVFWTKKLGITEAEFNSVMASAPTFFHDYQNSVSYRRRLKTIASICKANFEIRCAVSSGGDIEMADVGVVTSLSLVC